MRGAWFRPITVTELDAWDCSRVSQCDRVKVYRTVRALQALIDRCVDLVAHVEGLLEQPDQEHPISPSYRESLAMSAESVHKHLERMGVPLGSFPASGHPNDAQCAS